MAHIPMLIIVSGPPGSGKPTLGTRVAQKFELPFFPKDPPFWDGSSTAEHASRLLFHPTRCIGNRQ